MSRSSAQEREQKIIELRQKGVANEVIIAQLNLSSATFNHTVHRLITEGRLTRRKRGPKPPSEAERLERERRVAERRQQRVGRKPSRLDLNSERSKTIIGLKKQRATLDEIGSALKVTMERARQIINRMIAKYGAEIFTPDEPLWTVAEAAAEVQASYCVVLDLCRQGLIPYRRRGVVGYLLTQEGMTALKEHFPSTPESELLVCTVCRRVYIYTRGHKYPDACTREECQKKLQKSRRHNLLNQEATQDSLIGWHRDWFVRWQAHELLHNEEWLTPSQASQRAGMSLTQLNWLYQRGIVTTRPHPTKKWRGQPVRMYAVSEMDIIRQLRQDRAED